MIFQMQEKKYQTHGVELPSGVHTYCDSGDSNHTLMFLHGFSLRQGLYPLMDILKSHFRVVIPDLPFSSINDFHLPHRLENYVVFLLEFVQQLELENISIFGNSVGGTLGLLCCMTAPKQFNRLIVRCPLWTFRQLPSYMQNKPLFNLHNQLSNNKRYSKLALNIFYGVSARMSPANGNSRRNKSIHPYKYGQINPIVMSQFLGHLIQIDIESQLQTIPNDTLILWGGLDSFITSEWGNYLNHILPNSRYLEMIGEYHNISTVQTDKLTKIISVFLEETPV